MRANVEYVKQKFNEFNELCFEGKLQPLPFKTTSARSFLGQVRFFREKNLDGTWYYCNFEFIVSTTFDLAEELVEDVILHEMIHYYILSNQMQDTAPHGELFMRKMQELNVRFNRNISVRHKSSKEEVETDKTIREHIICVVRFKTNRMGVTVASKANLFRLWDDLTQADKISECNWYVTKDPYFNRFPRVNTAKVYSVTLDEITEHLNGAQKLIRVGNNIKIVK
jgi:predicted SprT family Zn-dependent metalloprotease